MEELEKDPVYLISLERLEAYLKFIIASSSEDDICDFAEYILDVRNCNITKDGVVSFEFDEYSEMDYIEEFDGDEIELHHTTCECSACQASYDEELSFANAT